MRFRLYGALVALLLVFPRAGWAQAATVPVKAMKLTDLSTMLVGTNPGGIGEWGFSGLLEVDGRRCSSTQVSGPKRFFTTPKN
jgi:hypothetical protein